MGESVEGTFEGHNGTSDEQYTVENRKFLVQITQKWVFVRSGSRTVLKAFDTGRGLLQTNSR